MKKTEFLHFILPGQWSSLLKIYGFDKGLVCLIAKSQKITVVKLLSVRISIIINVQWSKASLLMSILHHVLPPPVLDRYCSSISPAGIEEDINEYGGNGRQCVWVQRHDTELVLGDQHWVNCRLDGWKNKHSVRLYTTAFQIVVYKWSKTRFSCIHLKIIVMQAVIPYCLTFSVFWCKMHAPYSNS